MRPLSNDLRAWDASLRVSPVAIHSSTSQEPKAPCLRFSFAVHPVAIPCLLQRKYFTGIKAVLSSMLWCACDASFGC